MLSLNLVEFAFVSMILIMCIGGSLMNYFEIYLPVFIRQSFRYGKFAYHGKSSFIKVFEVPKKWFRHFYIYSSLLTVFVLNVFVHVYFFDAQIPDWIRNVIELTLSPRKVTIVSPAASLLALILLTIQCCRRLYDTHFVSVFASTSRMNIVHYLIGFIHYTGAVLAILGSAPKFGQSVYRYPLIRLSDLSFFDVGAAVLFLWACYHQYKATVILGNLRKNEKGEVVTQKHQIPEGDWFTYVSCPHLLAEILMYFALTIILWENRTWLCIFVWVVSNQVETALLSYWWYKETFPDFPKNRRALVPFVL